MKSKDLGVALCIIIVWKHRLLVPLKKLISGAIYCNYVLFIDSGATTSFLINRWSILRVFNYWSHVHLVSWQWLNYNITDYILMATTILYGDQ
jgi:hypothetical protein